MQTIVIRPKYSYFITNAYKLNRFSRVKSNYLVLNNPYLDKYKQINLIQPNLSSCFHTDAKKNAYLTQVLYKDPESKAEKMGNILKEDQKRNEIEETVSSPISKTIGKDSKTDLNVSSQIEQKTAVDAQRLTLWQRVVKECKHYYHGFKLLYFETKIASRLLGQVLRGHTLTRRERKQFTRTAADLFRLVPFSVFIIVPFMEFTLPIFLKLFPNMLPSTFQEKDVEQEKLKKKLKAKLEMAKFLQDTLEETALEADKKANRSDDNSQLNHKFSEFMKNVRSNATQPSTEDILKYSSLFENEMTLDNLNRPLLIALCQILDVSTLGNIPPNHILRFQLRMKIRNLEADDKMILKEGLDTLDILELQQACRERGMRALGMPEARLKAQLEQWLDLHLNKKIPISLLILSRALYLPENLPAGDLIKTTISALPLTIETAVKAEIAEASGEKLDNKIRLELLKIEEKEIKLEKAETATATAKEPITSTESPVPANKPQPISIPKTEERDFAAAQLAKETLVDKAPIMQTDVLTPVEIKEINKIIENLPTSEKNSVKSEIVELKKDVSEYKEDIKEVEEMSQAKKVVALKETKAAKALGNRVSKLIADIDQIVAKMEKEAPEERRLGLNKNVVSIDEVIKTIRRLKLVSNEEKEKKVIQVLESLDTDKDGRIDDMNDVLKVFDIIEQENVKVDKVQLGKILILLEKEKIIEMQEEISKSQEQSQKQQQTSQADKK